MELFIEVLRIDGPVVKENGVVQVAAHQVESGPQKQNDCALKAKFWIFSLHFEYIWMILDKRGQQFPAQVQIGAARAGAHQVGDHQMPAKKAHANQRAPHSALHHRRRVEFHHPQGLKIGSKHSHGKFYGKILIFCILICFSTFLSLFDDDPITSLFHITRDFLDSLSFDFPSTMCAHSKTKAFYWDTPIGALSPNDVESRHI